MGNNIIDSDRIEQLGRVIDGTATAEERTWALQNLNNSRFKECFMTALRAATVFNTNNKVYETV
ncbi:MAG: hypothetical protein IJC92_04515 [Bacteroidaceae bacterium]|nr:hypothetical protein [Bacteroidaceae bacterium]MBQ8366053.1 hypothetical protein [Bacteroidaceae bacterium]